MGRFDNNLNVTSKNNSFFGLGLRDNLAWVAALRRKEKRVLCVGEARRAREEGGSGTRSFPFFSHACGLAPNFPSIPFRTFATQARDNQDIL